MSAHVFYHADLDGLLVHGVRPIVEELVAEELAESWFFLRHWDGGPHVRLRVRPAPTASRAGVQAAVTDRLQGFLAARPSSRTLGSAEYLRLATAMAAHEPAIEGPEPLHADNSIAFVPYRREHDRYGRGASMEAVERHFADSSRLALALLAAGVSPAQRTTAGFSLLVLAWLACGAGAGRATTRAAPEGDERGAAWPTGGDPEAWDDRYARQRTVLVELAERLRTLVGSVALPRADGPLASWTRSVARLHAALDGTPDERLATVDACAHLVCNRLGILPGEEGYLRHLARRCLADLARRDGPPPGEVPS